MFNTMKRKTSLALGLSITVAAILLACTSESKAKPNYIFKEGQGPAGAVASIDGKPITEEEAIGENRLEYAELQKKAFDFITDGVGNALLKSTYEAEAKKANLTIMEYVDTKVLKDVKVSEAEIQKFAKDRGVPPEQMKDLKAKISGYLTMQKKQEALKNHINKLTNSHKVEIYAAKPKIYKVNVDVGAAPTFGSKNAKVTVVEFSDFQCPFCSKGANVVTELKKAYGNKIQIAFKQFPLPMHENARPASEAAMCVNEQGTDKFWKYHDKLFANFQSLTTENLKKFAKESGADEAKFTACIGQKKYSKYVEDDMQYGSRIGVRSTPTFFVNGRQVQGAQPIEVFKEIIDEEMNGS